MTLTVTIRQCFSSCVTGTTDEGVEVGTVAVASVTQYHNCKGFSINFSILIRGVS